MWRSILGITIILCCISSQTVGQEIAASAPTQVAVDFEKNIAPIFQQHCIRCHVAGIEKGGVSLSTATSLIDDQYVVPGDADGSILMELILGEDGEPPKMPPEEAGDHLSVDEQDLIRRWIDSGAKWPETLILREKPKADSSWWAFQPLKNSESQSQTPPSIDSFVKKLLAENELEMNPPTDRRTLIRRATYDLTGLPPTPEEIDAFVKDEDPLAYEKLVDRLLASPHYGERWGRHWLDVVRFGESNGFERNVIINTLWPFRDYVIRSLNEDKPFDQLIREHIAGDVMAGHSPDTAVGSAFLVAGPYDDVGNQDAVQAAQIRANTLDEIIGATGQAFLGLTIACARCHDHKFDPITQEDYYAWYATFSGIRHGNVPLATQPAIQQQRAQLSPLEKRQGELYRALADAKKGILQRAREQLATYQKEWTRPPIDRRGTEDTFAPVNAKFLRLVCDAQDGNPERTSGFRIDEFEVWSSGPKPVNVALASNGGKASGAARKIEDFPGAYGPQLAIDGKTGARFLATGTDLTIELKEPTVIDRVVFSSARGESNPEHGKFVFVAEYRVEVSIDGTQWHEVSSSRDRQPKPGAAMDHRLLNLATTPEDESKRRDLEKQLGAVRREIAKVPSIPNVWIGKRVASDAKGPFHVFVGGSPQRKGPPVHPASLSAFTKQGSGQAAPLAEMGYELTADADEAARRLALSDWMVHPQNPLTPRVLANRLWHYHFGTGIVDTPNDFGYMGGRPTHPELLDFLAQQLLENGWKIKPLHRMIMTSQTYKQSATFREQAAQVDGDARLLWRFPPRRLSAEEIRDSMLAIAGKLNTTQGGPGFRLYQFLQDNVCTYIRWRSTVTKHTVVASTTRMHALR